MMPMFRLHLGTWLIFGVSVFCGVMLSLLLQKSTEVKDTMARWQMKPHSVEYNEWLLNNKLTQTSNSLGLEDVFIGKNVKVMQIIYIPLYEIFLCFKKIKIGLLVKYIYFFQAYRESGYLLKHIPVLCAIMLDDMKVSDWDFLSDYTPSMSSVMQAIMETWTKRCTTVLFFTTKAKDLTYPAIQLNTTLNPTSWQAYRETIIYISKNFMERHNWFVLVDSDTYMIMENLVYYLSVYNCTESHYFGHAYESWGNEYNVAGPGIVLSKMAIRKVYNYLVKGHWAANFANGDIALSKCLSDIGIYPIDTRDYLMRSRFLMFQPEALLIPGSIPWSESFKRSSKYTTFEVSTYLTIYSLIFP